MTSTTISTRYFVCAAIALSVVLGCNGGAKKQDAGVQGTVTIDGELAMQGVVAFHSEEGGAVAYGTIHKDGSYALRIGQGQRSDLDNSKIYPGKYTATVAITTPSLSPQGNEEGRPKPAPRVTDAKFSDKTTSELKYEVAAGRNIINIAVARAMPQEETETEGAEPEESAVESEDQASAVQQEPEVADSPQEPPPANEEPSLDGVKEEPAQ